MALLNIHRCNFKEKCQLICLRDDPKIASCSPQVWSGHRNCWTMRPYLTTGWRSMLLIMVWSRYLPSSMSTSKSRMSMIMPHKPPNLSIIRPSWRTHPKMSPSSILRHLTQTLSLVKSCPIRSLAGTPRVFSASTLRLVSVSKCFFVFILQSF